MKEKTLGDMIFSPIKPENPIDKGNEILFGKDGKPLYEPGPHEPDELNGKFRCDCCGKYFNEEEGEWIDNLGEAKIFYNKEHLKDLKREEMKTRTGEIPTFKGERP